VKFVTGTLVDGTTAPVAVEWDEESRSGQVTLLTPAPAPPDLTVRKVEEIVFTAAQAERSLRLLQRHVSSKAGPADARVRQARGQVSRMARRFAVLRHLPGWTRRSCSRHPKVGRSA
jgi:hypothetical protein